MVSCPVKKVDKRPSGVLLAVVAGLAFLFLLAALFQVVNGQVEQARVRKAQYNAAQSAIAGCAASYSGTVRRQCMEQVNASFTPYSTNTPQIEPEAQAGVVVMPGARGLVQAALADR